MYRYRVYEVACTRDSVHTPVTKLMKKKRTPDQTAGLLTVCYRKKHEVKPTIVLSNEGVLDVLGSACIISYATDSSEGNVLSVHSIDNVFGEVKKQKV
ncbi:hypothetical protein PUN28_000033 [Cardiocondyla obscurior]|uniref:Uncharacterized protein n=1 Tax=Cardiocondyla obscurior TaxID=286306 RepID=A0AAW2GXE3_9HYME